MSNTVARWKQVEQAGHPAMIVEEEHVTHSVEPADTEERAVAHRIPVKINNEEVELPDREMTGLEIKQEAVDQGVGIDLGFQLSVKRGHRYQVVADTDTIRVHRGEEFLAVAPDDNS
jgi:hypothetical protein